MQDISFFENADLMVLGSIIAVVALGVVLVIIIFTVKFKSQHEVIDQLKHTLEDKIEKANLLDESLSEVRILNASQLQELSQQEEKRAKLHEEIDTLTAELKKANDKIEELNSKIVSLEIDKSELGANVKNAKERVVELEEALAHATKRNEFWVEQMTEVRTKYEALKLKMRKG